MAVPGKKLGFMGNEFAHGREWDSGGELDWGLLDISWHRGVQRVTADLNRLYRSLPALHELDFEVQGFRWIDCHDAENSVISFVRCARDGAFVVVALNFTPVPRHGYRLGVPRAGDYSELFNSDSRHYGGSDLGNSGLLTAPPEPRMGFPASVALTLPPLAGLILAPR
jgi:1,4-alpha-glucan branching enzyme